MTYTIDGKQGRSVGVDAVATFSVTVSGVITPIPTSLGRRDYIKIANNGGTDIKLYSSMSVADADALLIANGSTFEDNTNAPLYIKSTGGANVVSIYERKNK